MALSAVLKVDLKVVNSKLDSFKSKRQQLKSVMDNIERVMKSLCAVSWVSPASKALFNKFQMLSKQIAEALRIVDEYISDLTFVIEQYTKIEQRLTDTSDKLKTDIFGV